MNILERIAGEKRKEVERLKKVRPLNKLPKPGKSSRNFLRAVGKKGSVIAEVKKASPSAGTLSKNLDVKELIGLYNGYADALSILTEKKFFKGDIRNLDSARKNSHLPLLRKDFIVDSYQITESRFYGADAILLILSILSDKEAKQFMGEAKALGMDSLVEVHSKAELKRALSIGAKIIGINNRNLKTMKVSLSTTNRLVGAIPKPKRRKLVVVSESGFSERGDIEKVLPFADSFLIGTSLVKAKNPKTKLKALKGIPLVKVCGMTSLKDAGAAVKAGADFLGFNFYRASPRYISPERARKIISGLPASTTAVGVFVNSPLKEVKSIEKSCKLDYVQLHGDESAAFAKRFKNVIKAIRVCSKKDVSSAKKFPAKYILFDSCVKGKFGGTGKSFNYNLVKNFPKPFFLSGGLSIRNVGKAVRAVNPHAVDVCSGVEKRPGKKSFNKVNAFIREVDSI